MKLTLYILLIFAVGLKGQEKDLYKNFQQILLRGQIPAIFEPKYVTSDEADIDDDTWIFGIVINDQPRAYSLNILNSHEVVNDSIGKTNFAVVW